jgi:hypothetical protein
MSHFVPLQNFSTAAEAELNAEILREAGIAAILQGPQQGIFGAGFSGLSIQGVTIMVPASEFDRAAELIGDDDDDGEGGQAS